MLGFNALLPAVCSALALGPLASSGEITQSLTLAPADNQADDFLGWSVDMSGTIGIVGAPHDSDTAFRAGSAYLFDLSTGAQIAELHAEDGTNSDRFGSSVAISGSLAVMGAPGDNTGTAGGAGAGSAYVFDVVTGEQLFKLMAADANPFDRFGDSVDISGTTIVVGARQHDASGVDAGAVYLFDATTGLQLAKLFPGDPSAGAEFGRAVAIHGDTVLVGGMFDSSQGASTGSAYLFDASTGAQLAKLLPADSTTTNRFGSSVALNETLALVGADGASNGGAAYLFDLASGTQTHKLISQEVAGGYSFGSSAALSESTALVGARSGGPKPFAGGGSAYLFDLNTGIEGSTLLASGRFLGKDFGSGVALLGTLALVGDSDHGGNGLNAGIAYLLGPVPESYCTGGTSATGCRAAITGRGVASATLASGFEIVAEGVPGLRNGIFFYGTSGRQANAWGNGNSFQCVAPPVSRGALQVGHGTVGLCDSSLVMDLNSRWCASCPKPAQNPGAGIIMQAQLWYRDPLNTSNQTTSLSNAVEFTVAP